MMTAQHHRPVAAGETGGDLPETAANGVGSCLQIDAQLVGNGRYAGNFLVISGLGNFLRPTGVGCVHKRCVHKRAFVG